MNARTIPSTAVDRYLKLVRLPLDGAIRLLPGNGTGAQPAARLVLDRVDATVRAIVGRVLGDGVLREDAEQRRSAADDRAHSLKLRVEAERKADQADVRLEERQAQANRLREQSQERTKARRQAASQERDRKTKQAAKVESERLEASKQTAESAAAAVNGRAPRERLETLNAKSDALSEKEKALAARDEAQRLRKAASRTKAERKQG